jgi:hypothetical protein
MVRFSDMLGGSGEPDDVTAATSPYAALANDEADPGADTEVEREAGAASDTDAVNEPVPMSTFETPEAVLNRLTQYASSARAADHARPVEPAQSREIETQPEPEAEPEADPLSPVGDDFLPNIKRIVRRAGRGWKRHP